MKIECINSGSIYVKIMKACGEEKENIYRYGLMKPFEKKWACYQVPICAKIAGGYDVIMASEMLGILPPRCIDDTYDTEIKFLHQERLWKACQESMERSLMYFVELGIELIIDTYLYTIVLANPDSVYTKLSDGYCGEGGIPGYITLSILPNSFTLDRLPAAMAHECNHNVRFQHVRWRNDVTLAEMMITEGLAENFAVTLYGMENMGPWVSKVSVKELREYIIPIIREGLDVKGLDNITAYLYGDDIALQQGYIPVGLPFCAGYACGFYMVRYYLEKTGENIAVATVKSANEILEQITEFWDQF